MSLEHEAKLIALLKPDGLQTDSGRLLTCVGHKGMEAAGLVVS